MWTLKRLRPEAIPAALEKAERYRLLNQPELAQSICEDILAIDPDHQEALITLILAITDRFQEPRPPSPRQARELLSRLQGPYERAYYAGLIAEREGLAWLRSDKPHSSQHAYACFRQAMEHYETAEALRPQQNDDAILRWNTCVRMLLAHPDLAPPPETAEATYSLED
ncbi:MAG: hypothetical protein WHU94_05385 [Thermogemmata sp.]|jgi:tetratricopeptide (TPR) repeat protein|uniref:Tetratricopeptide repeat protein n=1 Tax=Thermogemmata fonticola TaxID=2755323 RepID=A0A7V9AA91_9BACT|nr:hypothetical protein [Thermogemmata fonticola]MBA2224856.1 hypothetical protein [Thermogemmata fonticola]MCX8141043.1 hypothetical protein [Gemmataceae bacterium]